MLDRVTIRYLQELIQANREVCNVLTVVCDRLQPAPIADQLRQLSVGFGKNAEDLKHLVGDEDRTENSGTLGGSARVLWLDLRVAYDSDDVSAVLKEAARIVGKVQERYQQSILATRQLSELLPKQYARVKRAYNALRAMRVRQNSS